MKDTILDKEGKELYNATGYPIKLKENGKLELSGLKAGQMISVNTGSGSERMLVDSIEGNHIICDVDGVERCVVLTTIGDTLIFKDVTD